MKIMFSAGEASGDLHGATLAAAIRRLDPEADLIGFGGPQMAAAGVRLAADMRDYSVMGFWEVLLNLRRMFRLRDQLTAFMAAERPALLVLIDYPDFNWRLVQLAVEKSAIQIEVLRETPAAGSGEKRTVSIPAERISAAEIDKDFLRKLVRASLPLGQGTICDPFSGSGSTLAAAEAVGYSSIGIERDPEYFKLAKSAIPKLAKLQI